MSDSTNDAKRKRGVRASPAKLRKALVDVGIKTQAELADRIADLENLDNPPRGLVNKIFRGQAVDLVSLERIARALNVESWRLYLDGSEFDLDADYDAEAIAETNAASTLANQSADKNSPRPTRLWLVASAAALCVVLASTLAITFYQPAPTGSKPVLQLTKNMVVAVQPSAGPLSRELAYALEISLAEFTSLLPGAANLLALNAATPSSPLTTLNQGKADLVIQVETEQLGRNVGVRYFAYRPDGSRLFWADSLHAQASPDYLQTLADTAIANLRVALSADRDFPSLDAQQKLLKALHHLDGERSEVTILHARAESESALRLFPDYAKAHAALCEALVQDSIRTGSTSRLSEAKIHCDKALTLAPVMLETLLADGFLARKQGDIARADSRYTAALAQEPNYVAALVGLAEVDLIRATSQSEPERFASAKQLLARAADIEPTFWKIPFAQARLHFLAGDITQAITANERAVALDANQGSLSNLGSFYFCADNHSAGRDAYQKIVALAPQDWTGYAQVGVADYYLRDFTAAAANYRKALSLQAQSGAADKYQPWGSLADTLRYLKEKQAAIDAYRRALSLVDQVIAKGDTRDAHRAHRAAYMLGIALVEPPADSSALFHSLQQDMANLDSTRDFEAIVALGPIWYFLGDAERAEKFFTQASSQCPGYAASPDFDGVKAQIASANR